MRRLIAQLAHDWELLLGVVLFGLIVLLAVFGGWLWREDPLRVDILNSLLPPDLAHPMGTDDVGRDVLARFIRGAQVSMGVAISVTIAGTLIGGTLGLLAGLIGGWFDVVVSRIMDAILAFPPLILAMAVAIGLGQGIVSAGIGVILAAIPWYFRLLRSEVLRLRTLMYVESAQALGASSFRLIPPAYSASDHVDHLHSGLFGLRFLNPHPCRPGFCRARHPAADARMGHDDHRGARLRAHGSMVAGLLSRSRHLHPRRLGQSDRRPAARYL